MALEQLLPIRSLEKAATFGAASLWTSPNYFFGGKNAPKLTVDDETSLFSIIF
jgi:hypothetical protein